MKYDFVIIGGGMSGLVCAYILSKEGKNVIVLEKNSQLGGGLQIFSRDKTLFETGVHYVGGLEEGQALNQIFKYLDLMKNIQIKKMDTDGYDRIHFGNEKKYYLLAQGYDKFITNLVQDFPNQEKEIKRYCDKIKSICKEFPLYNLRDQNSYPVSNEEVESVDEVIEEIISDKRLRNVLAAQNILYAGQKGVTPFYIHALIINSYIESSWRFVNGSSQVAKYLSKSIKSLGGKVWRKAEVSHANVLDKKTQSVTLKDGTIIEGHYFISSLHPTETIKIMGEKHFKKLYKKRIEKIKNSVSAFGLHICFKKNSFPCLNHNIYHFSDEKYVWGSENYKTENWPKALFICFHPLKNNSQFADGCSVIAYMNFNDIKEWENTHSTHFNLKERGEDYKKFKNKCEAKIIKTLQQMYPDIEENIKSVHSSSPLTLRDYNAAPFGTMYGFQKDKKHPLQSYIHTKTNIKNLYLTGQSVNLHGVLGVTISALITCFNFIDSKKIMNEIRMAK